MRWPLAVLVVLAVAGCGGSSKLAVSRDGRAVLRDASDGRLDQRWSCSSLQAADARLPQDPPTYSTLPRMLADAAGRACDGALDSLHPGDTPSAVTAALGQPDRAPRCWIYRWPAGPSTGDGARICFAAGRVARILRFVHG